LLNKKEDITVRNECIFEITREAPYIDKDESKGRNIDLIARTEIPESCKTKYLFCLVQITLFELVLL
jgi:hypothetical protein